MFATKQNLAVIAASITAAASLNASQLVTHQIRDTRGAVNCVVSLPPTEGSVRVADSITIDIRVPATPDGLLLSKLPAQARDYSRLPISVYLVPSPGKGQRVTGKPVVTRPISTDLIGRRLGVAPEADLDTFVRVVFQRGALKEQLDVVAERTRVTDSGEKVTTQTRCRLSAADAAVWR